MPPIDLVSRTAGVTIPQMVIIKDKWVPPNLRERLAQFNPKTELGKYIKTLLWTGWGLTVEQANELLDRVTQTVIMESQLAVRVLRGPWTDFGRPFSVEDYGVVSRKVVTTTGVEQIVDTFQSTANSMGDFYYHALGLSSAAEAVGNTALTNEMTTAGYGSASRGEGTQTTGSAGPHVYETVATVTVDSVTSGTPMVIQEHGIFKTSGRGSTGLFDRSLTGTQTLSTGDSLQTTYQLTVNSGG